MTVAVQNWLRSFTTLSETEKQEAAAAFLRQYETAIPPELDDAGLIALAGARFQELDRAEDAGDAATPSR